MTSSTAPFPLYLAPIEQFMLGYGQAEYPMTFVIQVRLSGEMDRAAFEAALPAALCGIPF